eukprot:TRINITY_DN5739_c0_g1_i11.p1 TRINITY_DN5739_c0_g1~~TRINITY_DN5739_c0_g1_i11.p1  ORF type:complete len:546 (-),score=88.78 TRINITY_DN5739_c0_g1_i11:726-2363(-)
MSLASKLAHATKNKVFFSHEGIGRFGSRVMPCHMSAIYHNHYQTSPKYPQQLLLRVFRAKKQQCQQLHTTSTTNTTGHSPGPYLPLSKNISCFILRTVDIDTLTHTLEETACKIPWSPPLVNCILKRLWNHGPKALLFFNVLDFLSPRSYTHAASSFNHAIDIAARMRQYNAVWTLLSRMRSRNITPSPLTFAIILERFVSAGKPEKALRIFLSMHHRGCPQDLSSFNTFLDILCKSNRVEMASSLFRALGPRFRPDTVTYNIIANGWCLIKRTPMALRVMKDMVERGLTPTPVTYNILLKGFFRAGQLKEAWDFFLQMKRRGCELDVVTYTTVVHGFGVAGEVEKAQRVFDEMVGHGCLPSIATYNALIQVLCKKDNVENALVVFNDLLRKGYLPNSTTYNVLIRGLCHASEFDRAAEFMERMKGDDCEPNVQTFNVLIRYLCDAGEIERSLSVLVKMGNGVCCPPNLDTFNVLISALFVRKKPDDMLTAGKLLMEMMERGFLPRKFTYNRVLNGLLLTGNQALAKEILRAQSRSGHFPHEIRL